MGVNVFPAVSGSPINSIQRGTAATAGNITISSVVTTKTVVNSFSTGASGTIAASGTLSAANGTVTDSTSFPESAFRYQNFPTDSKTRALSDTSRAIALNATNFSGGSTNLTSAVFGVHLSNATTLVATGACRYEVIEYV
jgi:hypothetical protein